MIKVKEKSHMIQKSNDRPTFTSNTFLHKPEDIVKLTLNLVSWNAFDPIRILMILCKKLDIMLGAYDKSFKTILPLPWQLGSVGNILLIDCKTKVFDYCLFPIIICGKILGNHNIIPL